MHCIKDSFTSFSLSEPLSFCFTSEFCKKKNKQNCQIENPGNRTGSSKIKGHRVIFKLVIVVVFF